MQCSVANSAGERCVREAQTYREVCGGHQGRWQRHGDFQADTPLRLKRAPVANGSGCVRPDGYAQDTVPGHPTANAAGIALRHRRVLYDAIGGGEHRCHWCLVTVAWDLPRRHPERLVADHLDGDRANNDRTNLVPACASCNTRRAKAGNPLEWSLEEVA